MFFKLQKIINFVRSPAFNWAICILFYMLMYLPIYKYISATFCSNPEIPQNFLFKLENFCIQLSVIVKMFTTHKHLQAHKNFLIQIPPSLFAPRHFTKKNHKKLIGSNLLWSQTVGVDFRKRPTSGYAKCAITSPEVFNYYGAVACSLEFSGD